MMENLLGRNRKAKGHTNGHWISVSDLMAGLMMVFLFIAIVHMKSEQDERERIKEIAVAYQKTQVNLFNELHDEFKDDLEKWDAAINQTTLSVQFNSPEVLFATGSDKVKKKFRNILADFFPRYLSVLNKYQEDIAEIRIEGHTSSYWRGAKNNLDAYFSNMRLSQDRTRSVLQYCLTLPVVAPELSWARDLITANGLSSSKLIMEEGRENANASRRVEFRVRTKAETRIMKIIEESR